MKKYLQLSTWNTLALIFITLKLMGVIAWPWLWVLAPFALTVILGAAVSRFYKFMGMDYPDESIPKLSLVNGAVLLFITLKLTNVITASWWLILAPLYTLVPLGLLAMLAVVMAVKNGMITREQVRDGLRSKATSITAVVEEEVETPDVDEDAKKAGRLMILMSGLLLGLTTLTFMTLKLVGVTAWSWWWVLSTLWIPVIMIVAILLMVVAVILVKGLVEVVQEAYQESCQEELETPDDQKTTLR